MDFKPYHLFTPDSFVIMEETGEETFLIEIKDLALLKSGDEIIIACGGDSKRIKIA